MRTLNGWTLWCVDYNLLKLFKNKNKLSYNNLWLTYEKGPWDRYKNFSVGSSAVYKYLIIISFQMCGEIPFPFFVEVRQSHLTLTDDKTWMEVTYITLGWKHLIAGSYLSSAFFPSKAVEEEVLCRCSSAKRLKQWGLLTMKDDHPGESHIPARDLEEAKKKKKSTLVLKKCVEQISKMTLNNPAP